MKSLNKKGQALTEYMILTALIAVASIAVVQLVGGNIVSKFANIANAIHGERESNIHGNRAEERHYRTRTLYDFAEGAHHNE